MEEKKEQILQLLSTVIHPEHKESIVALGMVADLEVSDEKIKFTLLLKRIKDPFESAIRKVAVVTIEQSMPEYCGKVSVFVKEPSPKAKSAKKMSPIGSEKESISKIIAIASGKGGVGKSTITTNIAVQLAKAGYSVGVIDADIYGPSQPKMFGVEDYMPTASGEEGKELITPAENYGVKVMSIGFFIKPNDALVWRGPMATNALKQLVHQTAWGKLDYLLIDLPPGTGDVHLTMLAELKFNGAIIVGTPQDVALADVVRGIAMFESPNVNIPIIGMVENMAWFTPAELPENRYYIFGNGGVKKLCEERGIKLLAQIPLVQSVCEGGDSGLPTSLESEQMAELFKAIVSEL